MSPTSAEFLPSPIRWRFPPAQGHASWGRLIPRNCQLLPESLLSRKSDCSSTLSLIQNPPVHHPFRRILTKNLERIPHWSQMNDPLIQWNPQLNPPPHPNGGDVCIERGGGGGRREVRKTLNLWGRGEGEGGREQKKNVAGNMLKNAQRPLNTLTKRPLFVNLRNSCAIPGVSPWRFSLTHLAKQRGRENRHSGRCRTSAGFLSAGFIFPINLMDSNTIWRGFFGHFLSWTRPIDRITRHREFDHETIDLRQTNASVQTRWLLLIFFFSSFWIATESINQENGVVSWTELGGGKRPEIQLEIHRFTRRIWPPLERLGNNCSKLTWNRP